MTKMMKLTRLSAVSALAFGLLASAGAAKEYKSGPLTIDHPWTRATIGQMATGAAFMTIMNAGPAGDRLLSAASAAAEKAELHTHIKDGDIMRMRRVEGGVAIPANGMAEFKPGGLHIMLFGLKKPLKEGDLIPMTLTFRNAGVVNIEVKTQKLSAPAPGAHNHKHKH